MIINSNLKTFKRGIAIGKATGMVDDIIVCTAEFAVSLPNSFENLTPKIKHNS